MRTLLLGGLSLLAAGCQAPPPAPPPAMSDAQKAACMRGVIATDLQGLPRLTPASARAMGERAAGQCGYEAGQDLESATAEGAGFATQLQVALNRRRIVAVNGDLAASPREEAARPPTREQEIQEARELYAACIRDNAISLARATTESAIVVAEAAGGACAVDRARLAQLGGARLQEDMDRLNRPIALNTIIRARAAAPASQGAPPARP